MATSDVAGDIFETNPYESHGGLSPLEADVLWEYAKLAQHVKIVSCFATLSYRKHPNMKLRPSITRSARCKDASTRRRTRQDTCEAAERAGDEDGIGVDAGTFCALRLTC